MSGLHSWLLDKSTSDTYMFIKRLSANDTGATGGYQVGISRVSARHERT
ncbi:restriction endonuclease, partial [Salmonella enterica subsp. enterica]